MNSGYKTLTKTISIHFFLMYALSYILVDQLSHAYFFSTRPLYMTIVMVAPMVFLMVFFMRDMLPNKQRNLQLLVGSAAIFVLAVIGARNQIGVGDELFLKSMIPHHSGAITVCEEATITDPEIAALCVEIIEAQEQEIEQMETILERLK